MRKLEQIPDPELSLPLVQIETITQLEEEQLPTTAMYDDVFANNPDVALYIRRRAHELGGADLTRTEDISKLALEVIEIVDRQITINGLNKRLGA